MKIYAMFLLAMSSVVAATCVFGGVAPVVVLPDSPTAVEKSAAEELAGELGKCLGEKPKVIAEADLAKDATAASLFVGATKAAKVARGAGTAVSSKPPYQVDEVFLKSWTAIRRARRCMRSISISKSIAACGGGPPTRRRIRSSTRSP